MKALLDRSVVIGIGMMIVLLGVGAATSYQNIRSLRNNANWVVHTHEIDRRAVDLTRTLTEVVVSVRGHLIHGDENSRDTATASLARANIEFEALQALTVDNPQQQARPRKLRDSLDAMAHRAGELLTLKSRAAEDFAMQDGQLNSALFAARVVLGEFSATESRLLSYREEEVGRALETTLLGSVVLFCMGLGLFTAIIELLRRNATAHGLQQARLVSEREQLNVTLASIEDAVVTVDRHGIITQWNLAAEQLTGISHSDAIGLNCQQVFVPGR